MKKLFLLLISLFFISFSFSQSLLNNREKEVICVLNEKNISPNQILEKIKNINYSYTGINFYANEKEDFVIRKKINEKKLISSLNVDNETKTKLLLETENFFEQITFQKPSDNIVASLSQKNKSQIGSTNDWYKKRMLNTLDVERVRQRDEKRFSSTSNNNATNKNGYNGYVIFDLTKRCSNEYRMLQRASFIIYEVDEKGKKLEGTTPKIGDIGVSEKRYFYLPDGLYKSEMTYKGKTWVYLFEVTAGEPTGYDNEGFSYEWRNRLEIYY